MPAYTTFMYTGTATNQSLAIKAVDYELRVTKIELYSLDSDGVYVVLNRYDGSTLSGGTAADIIPLWDGAPPASAVARLGALSISGTARLINCTMVPIGSTTTTVYYTTEYHYSGASGSIETPMTLTLQPGSVLEVTPTNVWHIANFFFEEMHIPKAY